MAISAVRMPKWGLSMTQGLVGSWHVEIGSPVKVGDELFEVETDKIANVVEALSSGVLRRVVVSAGSTAPVGALLGVIADATASEDEIDLFVAQAVNSERDIADAGADAGSLKPEYVHVGTHSLRIARVGELGTPPFVLIHGFAGDLNNWQFMIPGIAEQFDVLAIDLPGHGGSTRDVADGSVSFMASLVLKVLSELGIGRYHLVGHSLGGLVALALAASGRESVLSLTLICPPGLGGSMVDPEFIQGIVTSSRSRDLKRWLEKLVSKPSLVSRAMVDDMLKYKRLDGVTEALRIIGNRLTAGTDRNAMGNALAESPRALIIASGNDQVVGSLVSSSLPKGIDFHIMSNVGHMPHLEAPTEVVTLIKKHAVA